MKSKNKKQSHDINWTIVKRRWVELYNEYVKTSDEGMSTICALCDAISEQDYQDKNIKKQKEKKCKLK